MRYRQHLSTLTELLQQPADRIRDCATDTGVNLVEDQRRHRRCAGGDHRNREADSCELAARCNASERLRTDTRVTCDQKLDLVDPGRTRFNGTQLYVEATTCHAQILHRARD